MRAKIIFIGGEEIDLQDVAKIYQKKHETICEVKSPFAHRKWHFVNDEILEIKMQIDYQI